MKRVIAAFLAGLILATAGIAGASTQGLNLEKLWRHDQKQDRQIEKLKGQLYLMQNGIEFRFDFLSCEGDEECENAVVRAYDYVEYR